MWKTVKLGEVLELQNGYAFKSKEYSSDGYFVMRITNVQQGYISTHNPKYIQIESPSKLTKFILEEGDILVSLTGDVGRVGVIHEEHLPAALNQRVARVQAVDASLDRDFLFHFLNSAIFRNQVEALGRGAAQANVSTKDILEISLELPPLAEQQRIVAKLDAAFAEIDRAIKLEGEKEAEATVLERKFLEKTFATPYPVTKVGDLGDVKSGGTPNSKEASYWNGNISWYSSGELNNLFASNSEKFITISGLKNSNAKLFPKDTLLVGMYDTAAMKMSILQQEATFNQAIVGIPPNEFASAEYLFYALKFLKPKVLLERRGVRQQNLSLAKIKNIDIPLPKSSVQNGIVEKLNAFHTEQASYQSVLTAKIERFQLLKSAILTQELQPTESEAA